MTRKQEIKEMADYKASCITSDKDMQPAFADVFRMGAEWADQHRRWISIEEELPMEYEPVLAAFGSHYARVCFYCGGKWYIDAGVVSDEVFGVSHWMQIPAPPKKGGEE